MSKLNIDFKCQVLDCSKHARRGPFRHSNVYQRLSLAGEALSQSNAQRKGVVASFQHSGRCRRRLVDCKQMKSDSSCISHSSPGYCMVKFGTSHADHHTYCAKTNHGSQLRVAKCQLLDQKHAVLEFRVLDSGQASGLSESSPREIEEVPILAWCTIPPNRRPTRL